MTAFNCKLNFIFQRWSKWRHLKAKINSVAPVNHLSATLFCEACKSFTFFKVLYVLCKTTVHLPLAWVHCRPSPSTDQQLIQNPRLWDAGVRAFQYLLISNLNSLLHHSILVLFLDQCTRRQVLLMQLRPKQICKICPMGLEVWQCWQQDKHLTETKR